jgi:hypothetical protein
MKKFSIIFSILIGLSFSVNSQTFRVQSGTISNSSIDSCSSTQVDVLTWLGCINWQNGGSSYSVNGTSINVEVHYKSSFVCAGAISQPIFNVTLSSIPIGNYSVVAEAYIDNVFANSMSIGNLTVTSCSITGIDESVSSSISTFPNPIANYLTINGLLESNLNTSYQIRSLTGATVLEGVFINTNMIDLSELNSGVYFLQINSNNQLVTKKIIKD